MLYGENIFKDVSNYADCIMYMLIIYFKPGQILNSLTFQKNMQGLFIRREVVCLMP
jgi:hypothetical protein